MPYRWVVDSTARIVMVRGWGQMDIEESLKAPHDLLADPRHETEQLTKAARPSHRVLAELWLAIGDRQRAKEHALAAYKSAWADGEPYVHRYELNRARGLLEELNAAIPELPPYDPAKDEKLPWEDEVAAAVEKLRAEKEAQKAAEESEGQ